MKKVITLVLCLFVFSIVVSQTPTENYTMETTYLSENGDLEFQNYSVNLGTSDLLVNGNGGANGSVSITNGNSLGVRFSGSWSSSNKVKNGNIKTLNTSPILPDIELGEIMTSSGSPTGYGAKIQNGSLNFYLVGLDFYPRNANILLSKNILNSSITYSSSLGSIHQCNSGGGGSSGKITINNGLVMLDASGSWSINTCNLKLGQIHYINTLPIENIELGIINDFDLVNTAYKAKIENNWLVFYTDEIMPSYPTSFNFSITKNLFNNSKTSVITYYDGLGRPKQNIVKHGGGQKQNVITPVTYDGLGRQDKIYLPTFNNLMDGTELNFNAEDIVQNVENYYLTKFPSELNANEPNPYSEKHFESSPLNRVLEQSSPGEAWRKEGGGHTIKFSYGTNTTGVLKLFKVVFVNGNTEAPQLVYDGHYTASELYKTVTRDENWIAGTDHTTEEFQDKQGRVVLKRAYAQVNGASTRHDTYYVYDDYGNLTYVLSPEGSAKILAGSNILQEVLDDFCYQYRYDHRNRLVEKRMPGKGWEHIVYNKLDQPIMTRDMVLYQNKNVLFTNYDIFGRVAYTGIIEFLAAEVPRSTLQDYANGQNPITVSKTEVANDIDGTTIHYTQLPLPMDSMVENLFTINYYDDYSFDMPGINAPSDVFGIAPSTKTKGLPTGSKIRVLDTADWITTVTWYDDKGRAICTVSKNPYLGTIDTVEMELDFVGKVIRTERTHIKGTNVPIMIKERYTYDHMGRMLSHTHQIDNGLIELVAVNHYDELGQLDSKKVGGSSAVQPEQSNGLQTVDYRYNIRGWLKSINNPSALGSDLFGFEIGYNDPSVSGAVPLFNGNISETLWKTDNIDNGLKSYRYEYDALNRIKKATDNTLDQRYSLRSTSYDRNGNIIHLSRNGHIDTNATLFGNMDDLSYSYQGNRLMKIKDWSSNAHGFKDDQIGGGSDPLDDYSYDSNGNMISDTNKGIASITYNHLNLPKIIKFPNQQFISYKYDALGNKLQKNVYYINVYDSYYRYTDYDNGFVYTYNSDRGGPETPKLSFIEHPEGYFGNINPRDGVSSGNYVYQYKDHLGNIRLSYNDMNNDGLITGTTIEIFSDDFETSSGWDSSSTMHGSAITGFDHEIKYEGNFSGKVTAPLGAAVYVHSNTWVPIDNSSVSEYIYSAWAYSESPIIRLGLAMKEDGEAGYVTLFDDIQVMTTNEWVYVEKRVSVPSNITSLNVRIESAAWGDKIGSVWFDSVSIRRVNDVNDIEIVQENNYYPFGLEHKGYNSNVILGNNYFNFNGKELNKSLGLNIIEMDFRQYDPALGRFNVVDPLADADKNIRYSPYSYAINNPINYTDPDGRCWQKAGDSYVPCDDASVGSTTSGAFGNSWTMTKSNGWQLTNGADPSKVNYQYDAIPATGDASYYVDRYKNHIEKYNTRPPDYYLGYGHKYINRFKNETRSDLAFLGKEWLDETAVALQQMMNQGIDNNPSMQGNNAAFQKFAYETHVPAYSNSGKIGLLKGNDLWHIMWTPDIKDSFLSPEGRSQIKGMFPHILRSPRNPDLWDPQKNTGLKRPGEF